MLRSNYSWSVKQFCTMIDNKKITFDHPLQRPSGQWTQDDASLLIESTINLFIPDVHALKRKEIIDGKEATIYDNIDGKQRLTYLHSFRKNEWKLTYLEDESFTVDSGETFSQDNLIGKYYSELPESIRDTIDSCVITLRAYEAEEGEDEEEIFRKIFYRINKGRAVSKEHLNHISVPKTLRDFTHDIINNHDFYKKSAHFTETALKASTPQTTVYQSIILIAGIDYNSFAINDVNNALRFSDIEDEVYDKFKFAIDVLAETFPEKHKKFVTKVNIPPMIMLVLNNSNKIDEVKTFLAWYANNFRVGDAYRKYCGAGGTKKHMVEGRIEGLQKLFEEWLQNQ